MKTDPSILDRIVKAYDIRGTTPNEMNDEVAFALGVAFADFVKAPLVIVARDMRVTGSLSRPRLQVESLLVASMCLILD